MARIVMPIQDMVLEQLEAQDSVRISTPLSSRPPSYLPINVPPSPPHRPDPLHLYALVSPYTATLPLLLPSPRSYHCTGNKSGPSTAPSTSEEFRFGSHADTAPYSGAKESRAGSGSTGGAGYGNKTGDFGGSGGMSTSLLLWCSLR